MQVAVSYFLTIIYVIAYGHLAQLLIQTVQAESTYIRKDVPLFPPFIFSRSLAVMVTMMGKTT